MIYKYIKEHQKYYAEHAKALKQFLSRSDVKASYDPVQYGPIHFEVGQRVTFMNEHNIEFPGHTIYAFTPDGKAAYIDADSYWRPKKLSTELHRE